MEEGDTLDVNQMKNYTHTEIESLIERFEAQRLPKAEWTHEAHLVVAIWYSSRYSLEDALKLVRKRITLHNESVGTPNTESEGYHESITKFWLITAKNFLEKNDDKNVANLCNDFINSEFSSSSYPLEFYSKEVLFSVEARQRWIAPDLKEVSL